MTEIIKLLRWPLSFSIICTTALITTSGGSSLKSVKLTPKGIEIAYYLIQAQKDDGSAAGPKRALSSSEDISATAQKAQNLSFSGKRLLWVDDNPKNNVSEQHALRTIGIEVETALNTDNASELMKRNKYDVIVSDFLRSDDKEAAYTLLKFVQNNNYPAPLIIYSASATPEFEKQAISRGAYAETNVPARLYELVLSALQNKVAPRN